MRIQDPFLMQMTELETELEYAENRQAHWTATYMRGGTDRCREDIEYWRMYVEKLRQEISSQESAK